MLKKLVKYGNSNALVLDKAILELLNIQEGSVVKIKTDGTSIIITPQEKAEPEKVHETYTNIQATHDFVVNSYLNFYEPIEDSKKEVVVKELQELLFKERVITEEVTKNPEFMKEWEKVAAQSLARKSSLMEHKRLYDELKAKFNAVQGDVNQKIKEWELRNNLVVKEALRSRRSQPLPAGSQEKLEEMAQTCADVALQETALLNNPEYQHELQLIAEKYKDNQDSLEYINDIKELGYKYFPELKKIDEELKSKIK